MRRELANLKRKIYTNLDPWQTVLVVAAPRAAADAATTST